jgi:hypothetical protein
VFWELSTERRFAGGPIPASAIDSMAADNGLTRHERELMRDVIRFMDRAFLTFKEDTPPNDET